jgi:ABC-2 family transporter protein
MQPLLAVARLTLRALLRFRLVLVLGALLLTVVIVLPLVLKHDGSAQGFTQILITYTLSSITALLGLATLWMGCGTLARETEDFSIQLLCSKPIPRWQIWLGKWLGIMVLNLVLLSVAGISVLVLLEYKARSLEPAEQSRLRAEVLVARNSAKEPPPNVEAEVQKRYQERIKRESIQTMDHDFVRKQIREELLAAVTYLRPGDVRRWVVPLGAGAAESLKDIPLYLRAKIYSPEYAGTGATFEFGWEVGPTEGHRRQRFRNSFGAESFTTFPIEPNHIGADGTLTIDCVNLGERPVLFGLQDGLEVLFPASTFPLNFARGLLVIAFWLGLLAAIGLCTASKLQFNVATFVACSVLIVGLSGGTLKQVIDQGGVVGVSSESGTVTEPTLLNQASVKVYGAIKWCLDRITGANPIDALSTGRNLSWTRVCLSALEIVGVGGGFFAALGIWVFTRRELAAPQ